MDSLVVEPPPGAARWCAELAVSITKCFATLTKELRTESRDTTLSIQNIDSKFDALSEKILRDVKETNTLAQEAYDIAKAAHDANNKLEQKVEILEKTVFIMGVKNKGLTQENNRLSRRCDDQETYSRRDNIVIRGVPEAADEDNAGCSHVTRDFFEQNLNITRAHVEGMKFVRCHRLGKRLQHRGRPVIVRFQNFTDRELVWSRKTLLKNKAFSIHENFANEVEFRRRLLYPILAAAKKSGNYERSYLNGDVLRINGRDYSVDTIDELPKDIHPSNLGVKTNDRWIIFGGVHSSYHFLSNYYSTPIQYRDIEFNDLEHAYQYAKAIEFNDIDSSEDILCAKTPSSAKLIGSKVKNFNITEWNKVKESVMLDLLKIKFGPGTDMAKKLVATAGKSLAEAGQSTTYSIGMSLNNKDLFKSDKWGRNVLGNLLMKVREELL